MHRFSTGIRPGGLITALFWVTLCVLSGCDGGAPQETAGRLHLFVSILPQQYFAERVGGDLVEVEVMVKPGQSPATYDPTPKQMSLLTETDAYISIGVPFEKVLFSKLTSSMTDLRIIDSRAGIELRRMEHLHGEDLHDVHGEYSFDPHTWLSPRLVKMQASNICDALVSLDSSHAEVYRRNLASFHRDLDSLDREIRSILSPYAGRRFYVYHPSYGYFADAYDLQQVPVEIEGKEPGAQHLTELTVELERAGTGVLFVQPQFSSSTAATLAGTVGATVEVLDPLSAHYMDNMIDIARKIAGALSGEVSGE